MQAHFIIHFAAWVRRRKQMFGRNKNKAKIELISLHEAAKIVGLTPQYLNILSRSGELKAEKLGRNWYTTEEWLNDLTEAREKKNIYPDSIVSNDSNNPIEYKITKRPLVRQSFLAVFVLIILLSFGGGIYFEKNRFNFLKPYFSGLSFSEIPQAVSSFGGFRNLEILENNYSAFLYNSNIQILRDIPKLRFGKQIEFSKSSAELYLAWPTRSGNYLSILYRDLTIRFLGSLRSLGMTMKNIISGTSTALYNVIPTGAEGSKLDSSTGLGMTLLSLKIFWQSFFANLRYLYLAFLFLVLAGYSIKNIIQYSAPLAGMLFLNFWKWSKVKRDEIKIKYAKPAAEDSQRSALQIMEEEGARETERMIGIMEDERLGIKGFKKVKINILRATRNFKNSFLKNLHKKKLIKTQTFLREKLEEKSLGADNFSILEKRIFAFSSLTLVLLLLAGIYFLPSYIQERINEAANRPEVLGINSKENPSSGVTGKTPAAFSETGSGTELNSDQILTALGIVKDRNNEIAGDLKIKANGKVRVESNSINSEKIRNHTIQNEDLNNNMTLKVESVITTGDIVVGGNFEVSGTQTNTGLVTFNNGITVAGGNVLLSTNGTITQTGTGQTTFNGNLDANAGLDVLGGDLTVGGTKFQVDVATGNIITQGDIDAATGTITTLDGTTLSYTTGNLTTANITTLNLATLDLGTNTITDGNLTGNWNFNAGNLTNVGNILPNSDMIYDIGSPGLRFLNVYAGTLHLGGSTTTGQAIFTYEPVTTAITQSSIYINPAAAIANAPLFGIAVNNSEKFRVDAEGDITTAGTGLTFSGASPVIDLTSATTLGINTTTNRPVTFGSGLVTANNFGSSSAAITGGAISNTTIGLVNPSTGAFTTLTSSGNTTLGTGAAGAHTYSTGTGSTTTLGNSTGALTIASGGTSSWTNTAGNLTIQTATSGNLILDSAAALNLGNTNGTSVSISRTGITTTVNGALTATQLLTGNLGATISGAVINLNNNSNFATNINTGTSTGTVTIGNALADVAITDGQWSVTGLGAATFTSVNTGSGSGTFDSLTVGGGYGSSGVTISNIGAISADGLITGVGGITFTGTANINATGSAATNLGNSSLTGILTIASGGTSSWTNTAGNLTIQTATSGNLILDSAAALNLGNTNATSVSISRTGITTTVNGALTATQLLTGNLGATISGAAINLNSNSNFATNINTGTSTGTVTIGNALADVAITSNDWAISSAGAATGFASYNGLIITPDTGAITSGSWHGTVIAADHGGTGQTVYAVGDLLYASTTTALSRLADVAVGSVLISGGVNTAPGWGTIGASGITPNSLDFTEFQDTLDLDANLILNQTAYTWTQNFTGLATTGLTYNANSLTTGTALSLVSTSTAGGISGSSYLLNLSRSGANANASHTAYGIYSNVINTGTTSTNIAGYFSASGATNNYGLIVASGNVGIGTTNPLALLSVGSTSQFQVNSSGVITAPTSSNTINSLIINAGALSGITTLSMNNQLTSTLAAGIAPFIIASNTLVSNLNADLLDGQHGTYYLAAGNISGTTNYIAKFTPNGSSLGNSLIYDNGTNVGIGTTAPGKALDVVGEIQASSYMRSGGFISNSNYGLVATNMALRANADSYINNTSYGFGLGTATPNAKLQVLGADSLNTSFAANIGGSTGTGLVVTNAGNVGIGTTAPTAKLQVGADATTQTYGSLNALEITGSMTIGGYSNTEVLQFRNQASTGTIFGMGLDISNNLYVGHNNPELHLRTNSTDRVTILSGGNVGIGTTNPPTKLSVSGGDITLGSTNTTTAAVLRFMEGSSYGSKYVGLKGPDHLSPADSITFTLPSIYGTAGQILRTAGATGVLSWVDNSGTGMANPMTAKGDLLYGSDGSNPSIPGALAIGAAGQCLVVTGGIPAWGACAGSAAAAGSATQIQFNISPGSFGASADFTYNDTAKTLTVGGDYAGAKTSLSLANPNGGDATSNSINLGNNTGSLMITANSSLFTGAGNYAYITNTNAGPLIFGTSNAERVRIDSVGNVGIGTTVASALLDIGTGTPTTAANGLMFGTDAAANLYRFTASTIKTDGSLVVVGSITGAGGVHTTLTSSGATTLGTGATLTNTFGAGTGAINTFGASGGTNAINGTTTILGITLINSTGTAATTVGNSTGALTIASGGTSGWTNTAGNLTLSTATSGTLALTSAGALNLTAGSASTNNITGTYLINSSGILSLNTTSNAAITTGTGLTTLGGSLTVTGTAWTATPTISGLITATSGLTSTGTLTANGASIFNNTITQAGAYAFSTGTGAVSLNGATTITGANTFSTGTGATTINSTAWTFANDTNFALSGGANGLSFDTNTLSIDSNSHRVGIGTTAPDATLKVVGSICASATDVACYGTNAGSMYAANFIVNGTSHLPDYVFENNYPLLSISDLKTYIAANKHLPGVPSAEEINQNGLNLGQMVPIILEKTEENTLYIIQNNDQISNLVLKTDSSITTLAGLQGSVDANLLVIQGKLDKMDKDASDYQDSVSSEIAKMQKQIDASLLDARLKTLEIALGVNGNNVNILGDLTVNDIAANNLTLSGKLEVDGIVAGVMTVKVVDPERKTIGQAIICQSGKTYNSETKACVACPDGETCDGKSIVVKTKALKENFRIFVTPETATPIIWSVSERENETSFTVKLSEPTTEEIKFNWWIVEEK